jgi:phosphoribulokinase
MVKEDYHSREKEYEMKYLLAVATLIFLIVISGFVITGCSESPAVLENETVSSQHPETEKQRSTLVVHLDQPSTDFPIAPGIFYPWDEETEEVHVRYYRVRCWPGCHSGSSVGLHPDKKLDHLPVYMTSNIDNLEDDLAQE